MGYGEIMGKGGRVQYKWGLAGGRGRGLFVRVTIEDSTKAHIFQQSWLEHACQCGVPVLGRNSAELLHRGNANHDFTRFACFLKAHLGGVVLEPFVSDTLD